MKIKPNVFKGLFLMVLGVAIGVGYFSFQKSGGFTGVESGAEAYIGQTLPPILFFDYSKAKSSEEGCYDLKWSSLNVNACSSSWRPSIATSGAETVCQGRKDAEGVRSVGSEVGNVTYSIICSGPAGTVSRAIKVK